ncbi:hypothetical protein ALC57_14406 [Trachymyrmex cornetzi]|uniref:Uncharacterized protein n=1 Tax=Trachymyrmex cornetzi TaxID=471704 RepID=A0A195DKI6_9HYME|nr:hypothetical protein ALC57_14406 [Trachymyrmex cornetzi]
MTHVSVGELVPPERHRGYFSRYHIAPVHVLIVRREVIQSLPASFGSAHQPNTFFRVVCLNLQCCTVQIFTHNSHFPIPESLFM